MKIQRFHPGEVLDSNLNHINIMFDLGHNLSIIVSSHILG